MIGTTLATVLVPTYDHGPTLVRALRSARNQSVRDIEILVVGDGVPDVTRELMDGICRTDPRVRFFDNPKGERHGEAHRAVALDEAGGEIVCNLSDDDLWRPDHVAVMRELLRDADFAHTQPFAVMADGGLHVWDVDLAGRVDRAALLAGDNRVPSSFSGHTMAAYRRLPRGWHPAEPGLPSDLHMYQHFLEHDWCRARSDPRVTTVHLPSSARPGWSPAQRLDELDRWVAVIEDEDSWRDVVRRVDRVRASLPWRLRHRLYRTPWARDAVRAALRAAGRGDRPVRVGTRRAPR